LLLQSWGGMGYAPSEFWKTTLSELHWLVKGRNRVNGITTQSDDDKYPSRETFEELKRRFPD